MHEILIGHKHAGQRLDHHLRQIFPQLSFVYICKIIRKKKIKVNQKKADYKMILNAHDKIQIYIKQSDLERRADARNRTKIVDKIHFKVLLEDEDILVINKPAGMMVHEGDRESAKVTVIDEVYKYLKYDETIFKPQLAHRLDKDTSGVMIICKSREAVHYFFDAFKHRQVKKKYQALVLGIPKEQIGIIDYSINKVDLGQTKVEINEEEGKKAITNYKIKETFKFESNRHEYDCSLLELSPETGRTHQLRIHLQAIHHPIIEDRQYGNLEINKKFKKATGLKRQFLHASEITFLHPITKEEVNIKAPLPADLIKILQILKSK